jgi:hypothetical protein
MKIKFFLIAVILSVFSNSEILAQWHTSGGNIYFNSGNVGIGFDNPQYKLDILTADGYDGIRILANGNSTNGLFIERHTRQKDAAIIFQHIEGKLNQSWGLHLADEWSDNNLYLWKNSDPGWVMTWDYESSFVGIGTAAPTSKLEVLGSIKSSGANSSLILISPNGSEWEVTIDNNGNLITSPSSSIAENEESQVSIYPNPSDDFVIIDFYDENHSEIVVELYDISGKMVYMRKYTNSGNIKLNLTGYKSGSYIAKIKSEDGEIIATEKIVK